MNIDEKVGILIEFWNCVKEANPIPWEDASRRQKKNININYWNLQEIAWSILDPQILLKGYNANNQDFDWDKKKKL